MSKGKNGKKSSIGTVITILILISIFGGDLLGFILPLLGMALGVAVFFGAIIFAAVKLGTKTKKDNNKSIVNDKEQKPTKNPYSVNFDQEKIDKLEALRKAAAIEVPVVPKEAPVTKKKSTGDPDVDKMIEEKDKAISEMHRLNDAIEDETLSKQIEHLEYVTTKIVEYIVEHPKKKNQVNKFFNYYLPTTMKLLNAYDRMDDAGISGTNIDGTKGKVEDMMSMALDAYDKQLDALFADEALDVSTDITVMENMLKAEGLTGDEITLSV